MTAVSHEDRLLLHLRRKSYWSKDNNRDHWFGANELQTPFSLTLRFHAVDILSAEAKAGNSVALNNLGRSIFSGWGRRTLKDFVLGTYYATGMRGLKRDLHEACRLFRAAMHKLEAAEYNLLICEFCLYAEEREAVARHVGDVLAMDRQPGARDNLVTLARAVRVALSCAFCCCLLLTPLP